MGDGEGGRSGEERKRKRKVNEVGYLYEIYGSWNGPYCFNITYAPYGAKKAFQVHLPGVNTGSHRVECYIEYIQGGEIRKTNVIAAQILVGT